MTSGGDDSLLVLLFAFPQFLAGGGGDPVGRTDDSLYPRIVPIVAT